jgi:hypothetical protein
MRMGSNLGRTSVSSSGTPGGAGGLEVMLGGAALVANRRAVRAVSEKQ